VFQAFLTTFLVGCGYKRPIKNNDVMFASGIKLSYTPEYNLIFENCDEREVLKLQRILAKCPMNAYRVCFEWIVYLKSVSIFISDFFHELISVVSKFVGENSEPLTCRIEDGIFYSSVLTIIMFHGEPLMRRVTEIIDRLVEAGIYAHWNCKRIEYLKLHSKEIGIVEMLDEYYSFNLYYMQPAF
jgi:hypothetical protein